MEAHNKAFLMTHIAQHFFFFKLVKLSNKNDKIWDLKLPRNTFTYSILITILLSDKSSEYIPVT